jgi:hypothetical protein
MLTQFLVASATVKYISMHICVDLELYGDYISMTKKKENDVEDEYYHS